LIAFLQGHLGTSRFYTFGAISPNYGSYFGIASINVNDVPEPTLWTHYISTKLDTNSSPLEFTGYVRLLPDGPTPVQEFRDHVANYAWVGVKYVVTSPPVENLDSLAPPGDLKIAYDDGSYQVLQLTTAAPFFQAMGKACSLHWSSWNDANVDCARPTRIVRRELYMNGWTASVNGKQTSISEYGGLFESVRVPAGESTLTFSYIPKHETLALWASFVGALGIMAEGSLLWRRARFVRTRRRLRGAWT
jgi:hypothetical protein